MTSSSDFLVLAATVPSGQQKERQEIGSWSFPVANMLLLQVLSVRNNEQVDHFKVLAQGPEVTLS